MAQTMKQDDKGRSYYTAEQVMAMAQERGLPCELKKMGRYKSQGKRAPMAYVYPQSTVEALGLDREWSHYYPHNYAAQARKA